MAECKETVTTTKTYTLKLSEEEAIFLGRLLGNHVVGSGKRLYVDNIYRSLEYVLGFDTLYNPVKMNVDEDKDYGMYLDIKEPI